MKMKGIVSFYGKVGCSTNQQQIKQLEEADYLVQRIDILTKEWNQETLHKFFGNLPVKACINQRAPGITSGNFKPQELNDSEIIDAMIEDPILIKRPLLFYRGAFACGFDHPLVSQLLGTDHSIDECQRNKNCAHPPDA